MIAVYFCVGIYIYIERERGRDFIFKRVGASTESDVEVHFQKQSVPGIQSDSF